MADDPSKEFLDNNANDQPDPSDEIIPPEDTETITPIQQIENMEVHKHPHHVTHKKKWGEYLLEFFMLFLAVFLGFVAENIREKIALREKEKIYISGIIQNLKDDTARIAYVKPVHIKLLAKMDSALGIPVEQLHDLNKQDTFFYHFFYFFVWFMPFDQNDNTIVQLRNAGGFNVIQNQQAIDSIISLYKYYQIIKENTLPLYIEYYNVIENLAPKFIRIPFYPSDMNDPIFYAMPHQTEFFMKYDRPLLEELYSWIRIERGQLDLLKKKISLYKEGAVRLIQFLQKEYHLEKE